MRLEHRLWEYIFGLANGQLENETQILSEFLDFAKGELQEISETDNKWFEQGR